MPKTTRTGRMCARVAIALALAIAAPARAQAPCPYGYDKAGKCREKPPPKLPVHLPQRLSISSKPSGAQILIDGKYRGDTPDTLTGIPAGTHKIQLRLDDHVNYEGVIDVPAAGSRRYSTFELKTIPVLSLRSGPHFAGDDEIFAWVNGERVGHLPADLKLPGGVYDVRAELRGYRPVKQRVTLEPGDKRVLTIEMTPLPTYLQVGESRVSAAHGVPVCTVRLPSASESYRTPFSPAPNEKCAPGERYLGVTPTPSDTMVEPGYYAVVLRPEVVAPVTLYTRVTASERTIVPVRVPLPALRPPPKSTSSAELVRRCERKDGQQRGALCANAGLLLRDKPNRARELYLRSCELGNTHGCVGFYYLSVNLQQDVEYASKLLDDACRQRKDEHACWYRYAARLPDPLTWQDVEEDSWGWGWFGVYTLAGLRPDEHWPAYFDVGFTSNVLFVSLDDRLGLYWGLALRYRTLEQDKVNRGSRNRIHRVGYGVDGGLMARPFRSDVAILTFGARYNGYFNDLVSSWGILGMYGFAVGPHQFDAGVVYETMPTEAMVVETFGDTRTIADRVWTWIPTVRYTYQIPFGPFD